METRPTISLDLTVPHPVDGMAATWTPGHAPGAPTALHTTAASTRTAHLSWTAPTNFGTAFAHYEVFAQLPGGPVTDEGPFLSPGANLTKLSPGGTYHFTVITVATDGQVSSAAAITRSIPATTPTAPKLTRVVNLRHALMAIWAAPKSTGGAAISSYKVTTNCGGSVRSARFGAAARHGTIGGLRSGVACTVRLRHGLVVPELLMELRHAEYDLVVAGSSPAGDPLRACVLGNVAREIVNHAQWPVLIVRTGTGAQPWSNLISLLFSRPTPRPKTRNPKL